MRRMLIRMKLPCFVIGSLGATAILLYQCLGWLRDGTWVPVPLDTIAHSVRSIGSSWVGLQTIFDWLLAPPLSIIVFILGLLLFGCLGILSPQEDAGAKPAKPAMPERSAPSDLLKLSKLEQKDRIQILMSEYAALRAEIMSRTGFGFQIGAVALAGVTWFMQQKLGEQPWYFWVVMTGVGACFIIAVFVNVRDLTRAAHRIKDLEHEVNSRAGEHLLVWETLSGVLTRMGLWKSFISPIRSFRRSELPPLDPSYLQPRDPGPGER